MAGELEFDLQASWVTALLDISHARVAWEASAKSEGSSFYGEGKVDDLQPFHKNIKACEYVWDVYQAKPESWTRLMNYLTARVLTSTPEGLRDNLIRLTTLGLAWVEDIDRRSKNVAKAGK